MGTSDEGSSASAFTMLRGRLRTTSTAQVARAFAFFALTAFIFWNRVRNYNDLIRADGRVAFPSVDAWYHRRTTHYTVDNFPNTIPFDPFTAFPTGNHAGQFGTVFDQLLAAVALVIGGGNPSPATIDAVLLFAPPVLGVLTVIPIYLLAKEVGTGWAGLWPFLWLHSHLDSSSLELSQGLPTTTSQKHYSSQLHCAAIRKPSPPAVT
jgi:dolichyl-diphosphooligosaccharide--protein glycosyltransferase